MKVIEYDKYTKKWSPRSTVLLAVLEALFAGFFFGSALIEATRGRNVWAWLWPLTMGFANAVGALTATLVALHNCPPSPTTRESRSVSR